MRETKRMWMDAARNNMREAGVEDEDAGERESGEMEPIEVTPNVPKRTRRSRRKQARKDNFLQLKAT